MTESSEETLNNRRWLISEVYNMFVWKQIGWSFKDIATALGRGLGACYSKWYRMKQGRAGVDAYLKSVLS